MQGFQAPHQTPAEPILPQPTHLSSGVFDLQWHSGLRTHNQEEP